MAGSRVTDPSNESKLGSLPPSETTLADETRLVHKLDCHIVPTILVVYLLCFLDRVNIGNARLYGLESDLGLKGNQFQVAVSLLFVTYILSEIPSNLVLKKVGPARWISIIATAWGLIATLTSLTQSFGGLVACRLLLGAVEGGLFPGLIVYLTFFYTRRELALRIAFLGSAAALAGACGGLLAYAIGFMDQTAGLRAWRWIFILEGIPSVIFGVVIWWLLADSADSAWYLNRAEKSLLSARLYREQGHTEANQRLQWVDVRWAFKDWKVWAFCSITFAGDIMFYGYSTFLPTIISGMGTGWPTAKVQAMTVPCYALGASSYLFFAWLSDRQQRRGLYSSIGGVITAAGYAILLSNSAPAIHYFGCFVIIFGLYLAAGIPEAWLPLNQPRYGKRTTAVAMQLMSGNLGGVVSPFLYETSQGPRYVTGHAVSLVAGGYVAIGCVLLWWYLARTNRLRREGKEDHRLLDLKEEEIADLGDRSPRFIFAV